MLLGARYTTTVSKEILRYLRLQKMMWACDDFHDCLVGLLDGVDLTNDQEQGQRHAFWRYDDLPTKQH